MKKLIDGKRYDTCAARLIGSYEQKDSEGRTGYIEELYRKKTGEFFLYGRGGSLSKYARRTAKGKASEGEQLLPLSFADACRWASDHLHMDLAGAGDTETKRSVSFALSEAAIEQIRNNAFNSGMTMSDYLIRLVAADSGKSE